MAASLIRCTGLPNAFAQLNPTHPLPRCFGSRIMRLSRTGAGNPIDTASNFQSPTVCLNRLTNSRGLRFGPESNCRELLSDRSSFTWVPPMSATRIFFFMSGRPDSTETLLADADGARESLQYAFAFRLRGRSRRPAFDNLEREKSQ